MGSQYANLEIWAAGFSFGAYVATTVGATEDRVCALIADRAARRQMRVWSRKVSPGRSSSFTASETKPFHSRMVRHFYAHLAEPKELIVIDRANHLFEGQAGEVGDALADLLEDFWCTKQ